jgi:hypothetical protein
VLTTVAPLLSVKATLATFSRATRDARDGVVSLRVAIAKRNAVPLDDAAADCPSSALTARRLTEELLLWAAPTLTGGAIRAAGIAPALALPEKGNAVAEVDPSLPALATAMGTATLEGLLLDSDDFKLCRTAFPTLAELTPATTPELSMFAGLDVVAVTARVSRSRRFGAGSAVFETAASSSLDVLHPIVVDCVYARNVFFSERFFFPAAADLPVVEQRSDIRPQQRPLVVA